MFFSSAFSHTKRTSVNLAALTFLESSDRHSFDDTGILESMGVPAKLNRVILSELGVGWPLA
jgi:hypothetical protein